MKNEDIENSLFKDNEHKEKYGDKYIEHYLDQYKTYLSMLDNISDRRQKSNEFFMTLNSVVIGALGYIETTSIKHSNIILYLIPVVGGLIAYYWYHIVCSYKNLNTAKFAVVHTIESRLPIAMFETEWEILEKGENKKKYYPFTHIELNIPLIFIGIYAFLFLVNLPWGFIICWVNFLF